MKEIFYLCCFLQVLFSSVTTHILDEIQIQHQNEASIIVPCVLSLLEKYFKSERALKGSLAIVNLTPDPSLVARQVLYILNENPRHDLGVMVKDATKYHFAATHVTEKAQNYFIMIDSADQLPDTIEQLYRLPTWNPLANVVILFTSVLNETLLEIETMDVLEQFFAKSVYNVNVMSQKIDTCILQTYTYFPYEQENCATSVKNIRKIHECENMKNETDKTDIRVSVFNQGLFPKIPRSFHMCQLNVSVGVQAPYAVDVNGKIEKGLEVEMLKMIGQKLRLLPIYRVIDVEVVNSLTTNNRTHGIYSDVLQGHSDIIVGGFYENSISRKILSSSIPYFQDDLTWCVAPASLASTLFNVIIVFNSMIWAATIIIILFSGLILYANSRLEAVINHDSPSLMYSIIASLAIVFNTTVDFLPKRPMAYLFLAILFFYALHFGAFYNSFLLKILTKPRFEQQISTAQMAVNAKIRFFGNEDILTHFQRNPNDTLSMAIVSNFEVCKDIDVCLKQIKTNKNVAVAVSRHHADNSPLISPLDMYCFQTNEDIYTYSVSMLVKKQYHLLSKIDNIIRGISESGLLMKWQRDSETVMTDSDNSDEGKVSKLTFEHVEGGFLLWGIGLGIASVVFIGELITSRIGMKWKYNS